MALAGPGGDDPNRRAAYGVRGKSRVAIAGGGRARGSRFSQRKDVPFLLVVGDKESEANKVNVRTRGKDKTEDMGTTEFVEKIKKLIGEKSASL